LTRVSSIVIGVILASVALLLIYESKGLLVGEGVDSSELRKLRVLLQSEAGVEEVRRIVTMHFGPQTVLLATELRFRPEQSVQEIALIAATLKKKIREGRPEIKHIFIAIDSDK
jgi:divalent metal cation (Fe/Co/Zn/Cd) transporter